MCLYISYFTLNCTSLKTCSDLSGIEILHRHLILQSLRESGQHVAVRKICAPRRNRSNYLGLVRSCIDVLEILGCKFGG